MIHAQTEVKNIVRSISSISETSEILAQLHDELAQNHFIYFTSDEKKALSGQPVAQQPDVVVVELDGSTDASGLIHRIKQEHAVPIIALVGREAIDDIDISLPIDDFLFSPYDPKELALRLKRLLNKTTNVENKEQIRYGDLVIDKVKYEVTLSGRPIMLTFREYELLKFLASNPGRVFTRDVLLNGVWGYDYYGGDRTVDVHIRRLRSKIEDLGHTFIETVRNIGYRFKTDR